MTNTRITTSEQIDQFVTIANKFAINTMPTSVAKAFYIDFPITLLVTANPAAASYTFAVASAVYEIRSQINTAFADYQLDSYFDNLTGGYGKIVAGTVAGFAGGSIRYYVTGQNPLIGALNNAAYELCDNIDLCSNNKNVNIAVSIAIETLDSAAQAFLNSAAGNVPGAVCSAVKGGLTVGGLVASTVHGLYVPSLDLIDQDYHLFSNITERLDYINPEL